MKKLRCIVLDIDSVMIDSVRFEKVMRDDYIPKPFCTWTHGYQKWGIYKRPYLEYFLAACQKYADYVAIWTKADGYWARNVVEKILPPGYPLLFTWTYKEADEYKRLSKVWKEFASYGLNETNTIIVEDTPENCEKNVGNGLIVPAFLAEHDPDDIIFPLLCHYLKNNIVGRNVLDVDFSHWRLDAIEDVMKNKFKLVRWINLSGGDSKDKKGGSKKGESTRANKKDSKNQRDKKKSK